MEIASIGLKVEGVRDIDRASDSLDDLTRSSERAERSQDGLSSESRKSSQSIKRVGSESALSSRSVTSLASAARVAAGALAAVGVSVGFSQAIREIADFQGAMNGLAAVSGATADEMARLEEQARSLGATSQFSAQQAAEGQRFLAQAGFEVNEILGATPGILRLASAGQLDLAQAADIASNVLGGMRLEVDQLNRVNDVLAATAARSNTNIQQLGQALSFAAPFAAGAGVSIEEAAAAIGVMSDAGIQASRAGTGLVGVIRQLSNITSAGQGVLSRYGLSIEDVSIEARGLQPVLETLRAANLNTADAIALFGSEAGAAAQVLVQDYSGGIENATGEAERMADQLEQGLGPAFRSLASAASESVLQLGDSGLSGILEGLVRNVTGVISVWNGMGEAWAESNDVAEESLANIELLAGSIELVAQAAALLVAARLGAVVTGSVRSFAAATAESIRYQTALSRMAGVSRRAAAAQVALAGAARAASGALALAGGPAGAIIIAAYALYSYAESVEAAQESTRNITGEVDDLVGSFEDLGEAVTSRQIDRLAEDADTARQRLAEVNAEIARLQNPPGSRSGGWGAQSARAINSSDIRELQEEARNLEGEISVAENAAFELQKRIYGIADGGDPFEVPTQGAKDLKDSVDELGSSAERSMGAIRAVSDEIAWAQEKVRAGLMGGDDPFNITDEPASALDEINEKQEAYNRLVQDLRTDEERLTDQMRQRLAILDSIEELTPDQRSETAGRIAGAAFQDSPEFGGLAPEIGGAFGELNKIGEAELELQGWYDTQLSMLDQYRSERADLSAQWDEQEERLKQEHEDKLADIEAARHQAQLAATEETFGNLADLAKGFAGEQSGIYKGLLAVEKAAAIARSVVAIQSGIAQAAANPFPANLAAMASVASATAGIISTIQGASIDGQAHDGIMSVPADGTWNLKKGERVTTAETSARMDATLNRVNQGISSRGPVNIEIYNQSGQPVQGTAEMIDDETMRIILTAVDRHDRQQMHAGRGVWREAQQKYGWGVKGSIG